MPAETHTIHELPVETLVHIFRYLVKEEEVAVPKRREKFPPALILRSICQRWNAVAKATPELWLQLVGPYGIEWTRRALALSKEAPLDLNITTPAPCYRGFKDISLSLPLLKAERRRLRTLTLHLDRYPPNVQIDIQVALLSLPLPILENLDLYGQSNAVHILDENALSGEIPLQLKCLDVGSHVNILLNCPILHAPLTSLSIFDSPIWRSADEVLCTLSCLPQLEVFYWQVTATTYEDDGLPFTVLPLSASSEPNPKLVHLPRLQSIDLSTQIENITYIFTHVVFPSSCAVEILAELDNIPQENIGELYPVLDVAFGERLRAAFPDDNEPAGFKTMTIDNFSRDFPVGATVTWKDPTSTSCPESFSLGFLPFWDGELASLHPEALALIYHTLSQWPATSRAVSHLYNDHRGLCLPNVDPEDRPWTRLLRLLPAVDSITTNGSLAVDGLVDVLAIRSLNVVLPRLRRVTIQRANLTLANFARLMSALKTFHSSEEPSPPPTLCLKGCCLDDVGIPAFHADLGVE